MDKKVFNIFIVSLLFLFLVSSVSAANIHDNNMTVLADGGNYQPITSDLSNDDIQSKFDSANDGDTFEFTGGEYRDVSLIVNKKLNIISKNKSLVYTSGKLNDNAKRLGIDKTFGFYFTSKSAGSTLSGITILADGSDCGVIVDSAKNVTVRDNNVLGGKNCILVKNSDRINISGNGLSKATNNGLQLKDVKNSLVENNKISYNKWSGIETSNIEYCNITNNTIHHNDLNGISTFNRSSNTLITRNNVYDNTNGVYINSTSINDVVKTNSLTHSRKDPRSSMGGFEQETVFCWVQHSEVQVTQNLWLNTTIWHTMNFTRLRITGKMKILNWARTGMTPMILQIHLYVQGFWPH